MRIKFRKFLIKSGKISVVDHDPVKIPNDPKKNFGSRSRTELNDRIEIFWLATGSRVANRSKILYCFHQVVYPGNFSEKFIGRDPEYFSGRVRRFLLDRDRYFFLGRDRFLNFWVAIYRLMVPNTRKK
jgi:hypothetical protein